MSSRRPIVQTLISAIFYSANLDGKIFKEWNRISSFSLVVSSYTSIAYTEPEIAEIMGALPLSAAEFYRDLGLQEIILVGDAESVWCVSRGESSRRLTVLQSWLLEIILINSG